MNRLVIIGNGFDLAHGLPTRYCDFIDNYWSSINNGKHKDDFVEFEKKHFIFNNIMCLKDLADEVLKCGDEIKFSDAEIYTEYGNNTRTGVYPRRQILIYNNLFFKKINQKNIKNWVDIENEYYRQLKKIINAKCSDDSKPEEFWENEKKIEILKLNDEFEKVKKLLEEYLNKQVVGKYNLNFTKNQDLDWKKFYDFLRPISLLSNEANVLKEFINLVDIKEIKDLFDKERKEELVNNLYFLNFNYTPIASIYNELLDKDDRIKSRMNFIHGSLGNTLENKINFGFGDEMDEDYKLIENINDNEYLRNFKSFQYLQNSNYSDLLSYINSNKFQVLIMGHSCGLSDRTLLNTIFEHKNCRSIKPFFHEYRDVNGKVIGDNYTDLVQNISRHFNDKKLMRSKLVNKELCKPLPQIQLTKKE